MRRPALGQRNLTVLSVVQDRVLGQGNRARFLEAVEQAHQFGKGHLAVHPTGPVPKRFSRHLHCAACDIEYRDPSPSRTSFNNPIGARLECRTSAELSLIDYRPGTRRTCRLSIADGVVKPWQTKTGAECQQDMMRAAKRDGIPTDAIS